MGCEACPAFWGLVDGWLSPRVVLLLSTSIVKVTGKQGDDPNKLENKIFLNRRRDLALQVLSLLETLVSPESDWLWILWHLDITTFSVTRTGQVSNMDGKCENHSFKGCSLFFGEPHPCGSKPGGSTASRGERSVQPQLFHGVETRGNWSHPKSVEDAKKLNFAFSL